MEDGQFDADGQAKERFPVETGGQYSADDLAQEGENLSLHNLIPEALYDREDKPEVGSPDDSFEDQDQLNFYANLMNNDGMNLNE